MKNRESALSTLSAKDGEIAFRRLAYDDLPFLIEVRNECRSFLHDDREFTLAECRDWFASLNPEFWLVLLASDAVGYFRTSERTLNGRSVMLGADLHKNWRGKGLGFRSWQLFLTKEFETKTTAQVNLEVLSTNRRAHDLYSKLGFIENGRTPMLRDGEEIQSVRMSLDRHRWTYLLPHHIQNKP